MPHRYATRRTLVRGRAVAGGAAYVGPGNVITTADAWWGLRAYNAAYATGSNPCIDIVKTLDGSAPMTINILATGALDVATIAALGYGVSVSKLYDQSGNALHMVQATLAQMPILTLSAVGALPAMTFDDIGSTRSLRSGVLTRAQPFNISGVMKRTGGITGFNAVVCNSGSTVIFEPLNSANGFTLNAGAVVSGTATDNVLHAINGTYNGASSTLNVNSIETTGDVLTGAFSGVAIDIGRRFGAGASSFNGLICEAGIWPTAWTTTQRNNIRANQQSYWSTP